MTGNTNLHDVIIDTGASHHMTGDISILGDVRDILPSAVTFPNGRASRATKSGTIHLGPNYFLTDVLYIPDFTCTLISVSKLLKQTGCIAVFTDTLCFLQDRFTRTLIGAGEERDGLYYFLGVTVARANKTGQKTSSSSSALWHRRLGHPTNKVLSSLSLDSFQLDFEHTHACVTYVFAQNKRVRFFMRVIIKLLQLFL